jgi:hypothetical protein
MSCFAKWVSISNLDYYAESVLGYLIFAMKDELDIVRDISAKFMEAGIPFMLTGSMAMNYYAQPRMTRDIDVVVALEAKDIPNIVRLFGSDYYVPREAIESSIDHGSMFNLIHFESVVKVDCIIRKSTLYRQLEFSRRQPVSIQNFKTFIVSKEDLIISKLFWAKDSHSEIQIRDVKNLLATGYDSTYLEKWTQELDLNTLLQECLQ